MAFYPAQLQSANLEQFGIVYADEIQGHKTVANLDALYNISDAILSKSTNNSDNDAIGQEWYVISEGHYYRLDNWTDRRQASGWRQLQNTDSEFDSLESHGADKIKSFTTSTDTVTLNYNTWKNSETNTDGSVTIPAATGDQAGVLTANGKDQLTQLNKIGEVTHLTDDGVFTTDADNVTMHYQCINSTEGATSDVVTKTATISAVTTTTAGVMTAADKVMLDTTLPNQISTETSNRIDAINNLRMFSTVNVAGTDLAADSNADTLTITAGSNVTLTPNAGGDSFTISSSYVNTTYSAGTNLTLSGTTFALANTINLTRVNASSGFFQQSDKRLKSNIKPLEHSLEDICSIPTDSFILNGKQDLGTLAQEVEKVAPELVEECEIKIADVPNPENFDKIEKDGEIYVLVKEVDYARLSIIALEGVKLLKKEIDELKKELNK